MSDEKLTHSHIAAYISSLAALLTALLALAGFLRGNSDPKGKDIPTTAKIQLGFSIMAPSLVGPPKVVIERDAANERVAQLTPTVVPQPTAIKAATTPAAPATPMDTPSVGSCLGLPKGLTARSGQVSTAITGVTFSYTVHVVLSNESDEQVALISTFPGKLTDNVHNDLNSSQNSLPFQREYIFRADSHQYLLHAGRKIDPGLSQVVTYTFIDAKKVGSSASFDANLAYAFGPAPTPSTEPDAKEGLTALHCDLSIEPAEHR